MDHSISGLYKAPSPGAAIVREQGDSKPARFPGWLGPTPAAVEALRVNRLYARYFRVILLCVIAIGGSLWIFQPAPLEKYFSATPWWILGGALLGFVVAWSILDKLLRRGSPAQAPPPRLPQWANILIGAYSFLFPLIYELFLKSWFRTRYGVEGRAEQVLAYFAFPILVGLITKMHDNAKQVENVATD